MKLNYLGFLLWALFFVNPVFSKDYILFPATASVAVGKTVNLSIMEVDSSKPNSQPTVIFPEDLASESWFMNGAAVPHKLTNKNGALLARQVVSIYTAPQKMPVKNPVAISVTIKHLDGTKETLVSNITVDEDENAFSISDSHVIANEHYSVTSGLVGFSPTKAAYSQSEKALIVTINGVTPDDLTPVSIELLMRGKSRGIYPWKLIKQNGDNVPGNFLELVVNSDVISSVDCRQQGDECKPYSLRGYNTIDKIENGKISGHYAGKLVWVDPVTAKHHYMNINGHFNGDVIDEP